MDIATIVGFVAAFGLVIGAIALGGNLGSFIDPTSMLIVIGGTFGAVLINYPLEQVKNAFAVAKNALFAKVQDPIALINQIVDFANKARRDGMLALEDEIEKLEDPFLAKGLRMATDGQGVETIEAVLSTEISFLEERHKRGSDIFATFAAFSPALGMIGTLVGLVQMLMSMEDPSTIGPSMAIALITTFYGSVMANLIFQPMSGKLKLRSGDEVLVREILVSGVVGIVQGENPRMLEQRLHAFLAPSKRVSSFE